MACTAITSTDFTTDDASFNFSLKDTTKRNKSALDGFKWTIASLSYLVACIHPTLVVNSQIMFLPPLETIDAAPAAPASIELYLHSEAGITLLARSGPACKTPTEAYTSLAASLLHNTQPILQKSYDIKATLMALPTYTLESLIRGMHAVAATPHGELVQRAYQLMDVNEDTQFEARFESLLLCERINHGTKALGKWLGFVEQVLCMNVDEKEGGAKAYGDAARFLEAVLGRGS